MRNVLFQQTEVVRIENQDTGSGQFKCLTSFFRVPPAVEAHGDGSVDHRCPGSNHPFDAVGRSNGNPVARGEPGHLA